MSDQQKLVEDSIIAIQTVVKNTARSATDLAVATIKATIAQGIAALGYLSDVIQQDLYQAYIKVAYLYMGEKHPAYNKL